MPIIYGYRSPETNGMLRQHVWLCCRASYEWD
ncbi:MAG: hypothetical protein IPP74_06170 [Alphaproteobacteria bacterium]|nr:hypothetical protein [Alphaproteobacteria bacterium]